MPPARALALLEPVLSALAAAHRAGLVHRDVKPENVLIADDGRVKVADFGLARAVSADTQHTATQGVLIGTVSYLAPELVIDGRADVYALGVAGTRRGRGRDRAARPGDGGGPAGALTCRSAQETADLTSAATFCWTSELHVVSAYVVGHIAPSSRCAEPSKPRVEYRSPNLLAFLKKRTTLPSSLA